MKKIIYLFGININNNTCINKEVICNINTKIINKFENLMEKVILLKEKNTTFIFSEKNYIVYCFYINNINYVFYLLLF